MFVLPLLLASARVAATTSNWTATSDDICDGTVAYNGICTPRDFPPRQNYSRKVPHPPYLDAPPAVINISLGRQLWVSTF
jgi:hypothetical protein